MNIQKGEKSVWLLSEQLWIICYDFILFHTIYYLAFKKFWMFVSESGGNSYSYAPLTQLAMS